MIGPATLIDISAQETYLCLHVDKQLSGREFFEQGFILLRHNEWPQLSAVSPRALAPLFSELEADLFEVHPTRRRARAKFDFHVAESGVAYFCESATATIFDKTGYRGPREHKRVRALRVPGVANLCLSILSLALGQRAYRSGYIALDIFRTVDEVVYGFHRDGEHFVGIYCVRRSCGEARTQLAHDKAGTEILFDDVLNVGDMLVFDDTRMFHQTTRLSQTGEDVVTERDVLILTLSGIV